MTSLYRAETGTKLPMAVLVALLVFLHIHVLNTYPNRNNPNAVSRVYLTLSLVDDGTLRIDECLKRYDDVQDKAFYGGHYFTDKAPGHSFLLVPVAWCLRHTFVAIDDLDGMLIGLRMLGMSLPAVLFWALLVPYFDVLAGDRRRAIALVATGALGTNFLIYATQLYAHVPAGMLVFAAFLLVVRTPPHAAESRGLRRAAAAGVLSGVAFVTDYLVVLVVGVLFLAALLHHRRLDVRRGILFAAGVVPILLLWMWYNHACFEHPLRVGFHFHADPQYGDAYRSSTLGMKPPAAGAAVGMLVSADRGVLFLSPVLVLAFVGWVRLWRDRQNRTTSVVSALCFLAVLVFASTTIDWKGGWSVASRYLAPAIPFMLVGVAGAIRGARAGGAWSICCGGLAVVGVLWVALAAVTFPFFPQEFANPLASFAAPLLLEGHCSSALGGGAVPGILLPHAIAVAAALTLITYGFIGGPVRRPAVVTIVMLLIAAGLMFAESRIREPADGAAARTGMTGSVLWQMGYCDAAIERYQRVLEMNPGSVRAHEALARVYGGRGDLDKTIEQYRHVLRLAPDRLKVQVRLARALAARGERDEARALLRQALDRARAIGDEAAVKAIRERLDRYESSRGEAEP